MTIKIFHKNPKTVTPTSKWCIYMVKSWLTPMILGNIVPPLNIQKIKPFDFYCIANSSNYSNGMLYIIFTFTFCPQVITNAPYSLPVGTTLLCAKSDPFK